MKRKTKAEAEYLIKMRSSRRLGDRMILIIIISISCATLLPSFLYPLALGGSLQDAKKSEIINLPRVVDEAVVQAETATSSASHNTEEKKKDGSERRSIDKLPKEGNDTGNEVTLNNNNASPTMCRQVYFWGGGKAGSTSLFFTLTKGPGGQGNPQNKGPFVRELGKEPCQGSAWKRWEALTKNTSLCHGGSGSNSFTHLLNGCPRETSVQYARKVMTLSDDPKFLMLIRDPVDRYVSFLNDEVRRGGSKMNIENTARNKFGGLGMTLARQGAALKNLLSVIKDQKQILIIPMESISINADGVIDAIMDHVGGRRWKRNETEGVKMNMGSTGNYQYVTLSHNTTEILRNKLRQDVLLLESLVGKRFSWSSWARNDHMNTTSTEEEAWLVTSPASG